MDEEADVMRIRHAMEEAIANPGKQQILTHVHFYQIATSGRLAMRWCVNCGKAWKCERPQHGSFFGDYWEEILERN